MWTRNKAVLLCLMALSSPVHADGIGSAIGGASGIGRGVGDQSGIITPAKLNRIALSNTTIASGSANGTTLGTASLLGTHTGTPVWAISDPSGTFTINSSTGVVTVLSNTALTPGNTLPITITVSGVAPTVPAGNFVINVIGGAPNRILVNTGSVLLVNTGSAFLVQ
jgi:hypothetical protein